MIYRLIQRSAEVISAGRSADKRCSVDFLLEIKDGSYVAINSKGLPEEKRIKKSTS